MKFHGDDIKFACFKATILKTIMVLMIICAGDDTILKILQYRLSEHFNITINDNIDILPNPTNSS